MASFTPVKLNYYLLITIEPGYSSMAFVIDTFLVLFTAWLVCIAVKDVFRQMTNTPPRSNIIANYKSIDCDLNIFVKTLYIKSMSNKIYNTSSYLMDILDSETSKSIPSANLLSNCIIIHTSTKNTTTNTATVCDNNENKQDETCVAAPSFDTTWKQSDLIQHASNRPFKEDFLCSKEQSRNGCTSSISYSKEQSPKVNNNFLYTYVCCTFGIVPLAPYIIYTNITYTYRTIQIDYCVTQEQRVANPTQNNNTHVIFKYKNIKVTCRNIYIKTNRNNKMSYATPIQSVTAHLKRDEYGAESDVVRCMDFFFRLCLFCLFFNCI